MNTDTAILSWLAARGVTPAVQKRIGIRIAHNKIVIPVHAPDGTFLFNKYRRSPFVKDGPKYSYDRGAKAALFGAHLISDSDTVVITEGELDACVLIGKNVPAVSTTGGSGTFRAEWAELLKDKHIYICYDNDESGATGAVHVLSLLPQARVVILPDIAGVKDITDYCMRGGDFAELMRTARNFQNRSDVEEDIRLRQSQWQPTLFHEAWIEEDDKRIKQKRLEELPRLGASLNEDATDVERAKEVPITTLLMFSNKKAKCIWHNEDTPSLQYYPKDNTVYCFGCAKHGDVIDVYRTLHKCSFREAVRALCNKL